jgi:signal transduction histidine kinase
VSGSAPRRRSLFWPIAGVFLLVLVAGTLAQFFLVAQVLLPLEAREMRARAELAVSRAAIEIAESPGPLDPALIGPILERRRVEADLRGVWLVFRDPEGGFTASPPGRLGRLLPDLLEERPRAPRLRRPLPPDARLRVEMIVRRPVTRGAATIGEIVALRRARPPVPLPWQGPGTLLLFAPIALLSSAAAGLLMVRLLVRRLGAMEALAARVAEGDLSVRVADTSGDEIGRVAERLDRMTERLSEARDRLEAQERQRRQLFADITHELATPLTSIRGYAETLTDPAVPISDTERARYQRGVLDEARRLDRLIRDLFELARLEAGAAPLERERLDWSELCANVVERFGPRFRDAGLRIAWGERTAPAWIEADGHRMEEVLENLLANALRYVPPGGAVTVSLARVPDAAGDRFRLVVGDDGPGVAADVLPHLFERFYRSPEARATAGNRERDGSGLGLAIVREIVERHGGTVTAETHPPHGLAFRVELPAGA